MNFFTPPVVSALLLGLVLAALAAWGARRWQRAASARSGASAHGKAATASDLGQLLFESSEDGVFVCDRRGEVQAVNPAGLKLLALQHEDVVGRLITQWLPGAAVAPGTEVPGFPLASGQVEVRRQAGAATLSLRLKVQLWRHGDGQRWLVTTRDLTEQRSAQRAIEKLARFDGLTGLPNRAHFRENLARTMERARRNNKLMALFFLDLDRFKLINDSLGHEAGDRMLQHVAEVLASCLRGTDSVLVGPRTDRATLSRLGGDEFTVMLEDVGSAEDAALVAQRLLDGLVKPLKIGDEEVHISASIGISLYPMDEVDLDGMIRNTDMAMYRSKALGRSTYSFFSDDLNASVSARLSLEGSLRRAIERNEFCLYYQPKANLLTRQVTGVEALIRWHCPGRGMVPPDRFISVLEETGLIVQAGAWVIREACAQMARWDAQGLPPINVAVNLSARQLRHPHLVALVRDTLCETGIEPRRLELELTESLLMEDTEGNRGVLAAFRTLGVRLAIDDFGTGHSSLAYLRRLDVDTLKIDRSFVMQLPDDAEDAAIATAVVAMGKSLGMKIVAEGVETPAQADFLCALGCNDMQGWLLSKALPPELLTPWLAAQHKEHQQRNQSQRFQGAEVVDLPRIHIPDTPQRAAPSSPARGAAAARTV